MTDMKDLVCRTLLFSSVLVAFLTLAPTHTLAQSEGLQIKPAIIEDNVDPGDIYNFSLTVTNISPSTRTFTLSSQDIEGIDDNGQPIFMEEGRAPTDFELSSWISLPSGSVTLGAGETRALAFIVRVPSSATPGSHFGGVFLEAGADRPSTSGAGVALRVGSIISLRIAGDASEEGRLREFSTDKLVYGSPEVKFITRFENTGNVLLRPRGIIEITDMFGKKIGNITVNDSEAAVFPRGERTFNATWVHDGFAFGRYQAVVSLVHGTDVRRTVSGTTSFWVLPLKPIAITLGSLLVAVLLLYAFVRMYIQKKLRDMGMQQGKADATLYSKKYHASSSRLVVVVVAIALLSIVFLAILFLMFA